MFVSQLAGFYTKRFKAGQIMTKRWVKGQKELVEG